MAGENATFFYNYGKGGYTATARCTGVAYGMNVIATESHARQHRAMYPHQRAAGKFGLTLAFKGYFEQYAFMDFLRGYCRSMMDAADTDHSPGMTVTIAGEDGFHFMRKGLPVQGIVDGDHVGSMLFTPTIMFETIVDPLDTNAINESTGSGYSWFEFGDNYAGGAQDDTTKFFYPVSAGSQNPNLTASDIYDFGRQPDGYVGPAPVVGPVSAPGFGSPQLLGN
jgi:hypothetical protein